MRNAMARRLACRCLLLAALGAAIGLASAAGSERKLQQTTPSRSGPFTDWVVAECQQRCPNLFLASWGLQCGVGADQCCQRASTHCTKLSLWASEPTPATWTGRNLTAINDTVTNAPVPALPPLANCTGGGTWQAAAGTQYESYPPCCHNSSADQTECEMYSGCEYEGLFAAFGDDKKSLSWVNKNNIAAFFIPPNKQNRKEWGKKWKNKKLRVRNPYTCKIMTVTIYDTCDDSACPDPSGVGPGCCTKHANQHGGKLVDLEYYTSVRFWGAPIGVNEVRFLEYQVV